MFLLFTSIFWSVLHRSFTALREPVLAEILHLAYVLIVLAFINAVGLWWATDWNIQLLLIGGVGAVIALAYAWLKFHALGDLAIFANFGLLPALGTSIVATGMLTWDSLWFLLLFIPITNAVLHANNTRDTFTDSRAHIKTMPMLLGKKISQIIYRSERRKEDDQRLDDLALGALEVIKLIYSDHECADSRVE